MYGAFLQRLLDRMRTLLVGQSPQSACCMHSCVPAWPWAESEHVAPDFCAYQSSTLLNDGEAVILWAGLQNSCSQGPRDKERHEPMCGDDPDLNHTSVLCTQHTLYYISPSQ